MRGSSGTRESSTGGFTLVEMIVTIGIIIVAAGFIAPAISAIFQDRRIENAASVISSMAIEARNNAVTKKQEYSLVFLKKGLRLFRHAKGDDEGGFVGGLRSFNVGDADHVTFEMPSADLEVDEIPDQLFDQENGVPMERCKVRREDLSIKFLLDGTIDFGRLDDVPSWKFQSDPPRGGDVIFHQKGSFSVCFVDIRPTGRVMTKVGEGLE